MKTPDPLAGRKIRKEVIDLYYDDLDLVMSSGDAVGAERPWQTRQTIQPQDVREWIKDPAKIDSIQQNLEDLVQICRALPKPVRILDVGCNGGYLYDFLLKYCFDGSEEALIYHGTDVHEDVAQAAAAVHQDRKNATFSKGDVYSLAEQFGEGNFDVVVCSRVLIHLPFFERAVMNLYLAASKAVFIVLVVDNRDYIKKVRIIDDDSGERGFWYFRYYSREFINKVINGMYAHYRIISGSGRYDSLLIFRSGTNL